MKIAIQGHPTRGKEIIQILESLGGRNIFNYNGNYIRTAYFIGMDYSIYGFCTDSPKLGFKVYTLEEFEKEFPFKIGDEVMFPVKTGWASGKITGLTYVGDQLKYEVDNRIAGYRYIEPHKLSLYPMKKERNITLTLDKAKEWYKKGGELKEIALQAFSEKELTVLPKSWEEFCEKYSVKDKEAHIDSVSNIIIQKGDSTLRSFTRDRNICPSKQSAEAHLAMIQLEQLRDCWRQGNIPQEFKYKIKKVRNKYTVVYGEEDAFLSFCGKQTTAEFLKCFRDLIEQAGDLI